MAPSNSRASNDNASVLFSWLQPGVAFVVIIFGALIAFEVFNYSTTEHALSDLLGSLTFAGIQWSTILAVAFCGIDFAGIARLFTPETNASEEPKEVWYLFGAWLLAATMNAILTWWGVSMAVINHTTQSSTVVDPGTINSIVPVFVAIMVWVIRILIIGTLSLAMDRLLHPGLEQRTALQSAVAATAASRQQARTPVTPAPVNIPSSLSSNGAVPRQNMSRAASATRNVRSNDNLYEEHEPAQPRSNRPEATYHTLSMSARPSRPSTTNGSSDQSSLNGESNGSKRRGQF